MFYMEKDALCEIGKKEKREKAMMAIDGLLIVMNYLYGKVEEKEINFESDIMGGHSEYLALGEGEDVFFVDSTDFNLFCEHLEEMIKEEMKKLKSFKLEQDIVQDFVKELACVGKE